MEGKALAQAFFNTILKTPRRRKIYAQRDLLLETRIHAPWNTGVFIISFLLSFILLCYLLRRVDPVEIY